MSNLISFDIESYESTYFIQRETHSGYRSNHIKAIMNILDLLDKYNVKAIFFILGEYAKKNRSITKEIKIRNHIIGSHAVHHHHFKTLSISEAKLEVINSKKMLEDIIGEEILYFRAPNFSIGSDNKDIFYSIAEAGYRFDSSLFPFHHKVYAQNRAPHKPFRMILKNGLSLIEFPVIPFKCGILTIPYSGGGYFRLYPFSITKLLIFLRKIKNYEYGFYYFHPWEFDNELPQYHVRLRTKIRSNVGIKNNLTKLEKLLFYEKFVKPDMLINNLAEIAIEEI